MVRVSISNRTLENLTILSFKDIGALSEENFDAVAWINKTLKASEEPKSKEVQNMIGRT